ncbi:MAG: beta-ketoacyl-ACP synthase II [Bacteriovoracaceae bacterium]|nr:beta-ketoacyl-ACP synthase II [Bacteriovoracaceae bacterium]
MNLNSSKNVNRVVVTGLGAICGLGHNLDEIWNRATLGQSGVRLIEQAQWDHEQGVPFSYPVKVAGIPVGFSISPDLLADKERDRFDRFIHYALHSSHEAYFHAGLEKLENDPSKKRTGVILGVGMGGFPIIETTYREFLTKSQPRTSPFFIPSLIPNMASGLISMKLGLLGPNLAIASACASAGHAIENAYMQIALGKMDVAITGGAEAVTSKFTLAGFHSMKALSTRDVPAYKASCPFSKDRDGFVMGEGAGILILENYEHAKARGANILAELVATGSSSDAHHITAPHPEGLGAIQCMQSVLECAQIRPEEIDYINAHGTSTQLGDKAETLAIKEVFGKHAYDININSTKSMTGHLLGAAAGIESVLCVKSLLHDTIVPTINLDQADPDCDLNYTPNKSVKRKIKYALNNSFGFGGTNSSLIFKKI